MDRKKNILLICDFEHTLVKELHLNLKREGLNCDLYCIRKLGDTSKIRYLLSWFRLLIRIIFSLKEGDVLAFHYVSKYMVLLDKLVSFKRLKRVATVWGGDFNLLSPHQKVERAKWLGSLAAANVTNPQLKNEIEALGVDIEVISFGLVILDAIDENDGLNTKVSKEGKFVCVVGTNGSANQQHVSIAKQLSKLSEQEKASFDFIIPMTYGVQSQAYIDEVYTAFQQAGVTFDIITERMSIDEIAALRIKTDVLIQLQKHDQLSAAMLESFYAKNYIITGSWLPYECLKSFGLQFSSIQSISHISESLTLFLEGRQECDLDQNRNVISKMYTWKSQASKWRNLYVGK
ncbi:hypothetical protein [Pseudoalteromonas sp. R3]|uniref:hypothetical protein n=1 Tax=Pseudoalteromonas sp. R3 TaxID=1709477 RepID=UPI0006B4157F|nr:hypothetical protein [Pseudoalteromonas sp. R3]AZZ99574.1 hypothetical protein ELR70_22400 [Pseudoalteromonas sp. R3]